MLVGGIFVHCVEIYDTGCAKILVALLKCGAVLGEDLRKGGAAVMVAQH